MTEKCINTGNWIEMCEFLDEVTRNQYGDIQGQTMSRRDIDSCRLEIIARKNKKIALL